MTAKLISQSAPVELPDDSSLQDIIAHCARVSNPANQNTDAPSDKLIQYLVKHQHWSPFEMVNVVMEIETTRDIARQLLRHRSFTFQEFSQRYADVNGMENPFVLREARLQDPKNRQNSIKPENGESYLIVDWEQKQRELLNVVKQTYNWALRNGIAKEQARAILPEGLTKSRLYVNGTVRSWIHYIHLRSAHGTQKEHQDLARECACELYKVFPLIRDFIHEENKHSGSVQAQEQYEIHW